jgi:hypothetical protein
MFKVRLRQPSVLADHYWFCIGVRNCKTKARSLHTHGPDPVLEIDFIDHAMATSTFTFNFSRALKLRLFYLKLLNLTNCDPIYWVQAKSSIALAQGR